MKSAKLVRWETPFTDTAFPSAIILTEDGPTGEFLISALVAPAGIDKYPKFRVHFGEVIAFSCMEEMYFPERDFDGAEIEEVGLSAYQFLNSAWLKSYEHGDYFLFNTDFGNRETLRHYLIFGGDFNIAIITKNEPVFETIEACKVLHLQMKI